MNWEVDSVSRWVFHCNGEKIMAKKKQMELTEENVQASENEVEVKTAFPKVAAKAKIRSITREIDLVKVKFKDLTFTTGQEKQLAEWMDNEDELLVTVTLYQARLM
jgi:hypothetical protein